ncbi:uncharacterized protein [Heptranchias perlo]|uniref:uncharacterized protein isoform X1 n=1 Tax=Heptranchias perlo TaxID=212740 RepID=UPI003559EDD4
MAKHGAGVCASEEDGEPGLSSATSHVSWCDTTCESWSTSCDRQTHHHTALILSLFAATCEHKGLRLEIGDTWINKDCYQCICLNPFGVGCCDNVQQPVDYPEWCKVIQRPNSCHLAVVMKANRRIPCIGRTSMGRLQLQNGPEDNDPFF